MPLTPTDEPGHYEGRTDNVYFFMNNGKERVRCAATLLALERFEPALKRGEETQLVCFKKYRRDIERAASANFDMRYVEPDGTIMVKAADL